MIEQYIPVFNTFGGGGGTIDCAGVKTYLQSLIGTASYYMSFEVDGGGVTPMSVAINPFRDEFYIAGFKFIQIWQLSTRTLITTITGIGGGSNAFGVSLGINSDGSKLCVAWRTWSRVEQYDLTSRTADFTTNVGTLGGSQANLAFYSPDDLWVYWSWNGNDRVGRIDVSTGTSTLINALTTTPPAAAHNAVKVYNGKSFWSGAGTNVYEFDHSIGTYGSVSNIWPISLTGDFKPTNNVFCGIYIDDNYEVLKTNNGLVGFFEKGSTFSNLEFAEGLGGATETTIGIGGNFVRYATYSIDCFDGFIDSAGLGAATINSNTGPKFWLKINDF